MDLDKIKRGLRAEIKKRENETYSTFQCNVRQMCKDVLAKLEYQESVIAEKDKEIAELEERIADGDKVIEYLQNQLSLARTSLLKSLATAQHEARNSKYKRCLAMAMLCNEKWLVHNFAEIPVKLRFYNKWEKRWLELAEKFKEA